VSIIIADASPLIALASIEQLELLEKLYQHIFISFERKTPSF
jgi:predicted nucleic acid-binding protein